MVEDRLLQVAGSKIRGKHSARLHWLLPDWPWEIDEYREAGIEVRLRSPYGWITLCMIPGFRHHAESTPPLASKNSILLPQIVRAGELRYGSGPIDPTWGWASPTYGQKIPALSFSVMAQDALPLSLVTEWSFPEI